eukprot:g7342.t1
MAEKTYCRECFQQATGKTTTRFHIVPYAKKSRMKEERLLALVEQIRDHRARRTRHLNMLRDLKVCERYCGRCKKYHQYAGRWLPAGEYAWAKL